MVMYGEVSHYRKKFSPKRRKKVMGHGEVYQVYYDSYR